MNHFLNESTWNLEINIVKYDANTLFKVVQQAFFILSFLSALEFHFFFPLGCLSITNDKCAKEYDGQFPFQRLEGWSALFSASIYRIYINCVTPLD